MPVSFILSILVGFVVTLLTIPPIIRISKEKNLAADQGRFSLNKTVTPNLGGVGIFIGAILSSVMFFPASVPREIQYIFAGMVLMFFAGIKNDIIGSSVRVKLFIQVLASLVLILLAKLQIRNLQEIFFISDSFYWMNVPLTLFFFLFLINAIKLVDGIEGLAGGITLVFFASLGYWFYENSLLSYAILCAGFSGALLGFLRYNLFGKKYKILMGNTGSLVLGIVVASLTIVFLNSAASQPDQTEPTKRLAVIFAALAVPITNSLRVFVIRIRTKQSLFNPDMNHIHHVLIKSGLSHKMASLSLICCTILFCFLAINMPGTLSPNVYFLLPVILTWIATDIISFRNRRMSKMRRMRLIVIKNYRKNRTMIS